MKGAFLNRTCHSLIKWLKLLNNVDPHFLFYYFFQFTSMPHNFHFTSLPHNFHFTSMPHNFHFTSMQPGACEGFCLGGGTICARPLGNIGPPLKNPFFEKILIPFLNFFRPPSPTWTYFVHHKNTPKRLLFWVLLTLESKNYSFA